MKYFWIKGRINRIEFLITTMALGIVFYINILLYDINPYKYAVAGILFLLFLFQSIKRGHDFNQHWSYNYFWFVIPLYNVFALIELLVRAGDPSKNKYGLPPTFSFAKERDSSQTKRTMNNNTDQTNSIDIETPNSSHSEYTPMTEKETIEEVNKVVVTRIEKISHTIIHLNSSHSIASAYWLVKEGSFVNYEEEILEIKGDDYFENGTFKMSITSPLSGYINLNLQTLGYWSRKTDFDICTIYESDVERQRSIHKVTHESLLDKFTQTEFLKWRKIELSKLLSFRLENMEGKDFICFEFSYPELNLMDGDHILFLMSNDEVLKFPFNCGKYRVKKFLKEYRLPLYREEIEILSKNEIISFRIHLNKENHNIDFNWSYSADYPQKDFQYIIKSTFKNFYEVVSSHENYQPLTKPLDNRESVKENDECHVYLMVDNTNHFHKIGISNKPEYREKTLQSEKPTIELVCHKLFPTRKISESIEKALHESFKDKRLRGEWFDLSEEDISNIKKTLQ